MVLLINCSPKEKDSNSKLFLNYIKKEIKEQVQEIDLYKQKNEIVLNEVINSEVVVLSFPLYVDSPPYRIIELFDACRKKEFKNKKVYAICNSGFLEPNQCDIACEIIKNFCVSQNAEYKGFFSIGAGQAIGEWIRNNKFLFLKIDYLVKNKKFVESIKKRKNVYLKSTIKFLPKKAFCFFGNKNWNNMRKNNYKVH